LYNHCYCPDSFILESECIIFLIGIVIVTAVVIVVKNVLKIAFTMITFLILKRIFYNSTNMNIVIIIILCSIVIVIITIVVVVVFYVVVVIVVSIYTLL